MSEPTARATHQTRTRRERAESVADFEELFHLVIENVRDYAIFVLDPAGGVLTWNAGVRRLLGYEEEQFKGLAFRRLFRSMEEDAARIEMDRAASAGRSDDERWHVRKDGTELWVTGVLTALKDSSGKLRGYAKVMRDSTAQRQAALDREELLQRELAARTQAERANDLKDQFLARVSHELRTPLNVILGWARLLAQHRLDEELTRRGLAAIERNAVVQARLVEELLDVSRIVSGKLQLTMQRVSMRSLLHAAIDSVQRAAESKAITISSAADDPTPIEADAGRLQQVMRNLLSNAIRFTPDGGTIEVQLRVEKDHVELVVRDSGAGIDSADLPYVFDRYHQAASDRETGGGLGLGLTIARHIVEAHSGSIDALSEGPGKGATFVIRLPRRGTSPTPEPSTIENVARPIECPPVLIGRRVLIVEDQLDSRELAAFVLGRCGMDVLTVDSAAEALELLDAHDVDVIVSDIELAGSVDGCELIRRIRQRPGAAGRIPAVVVSARTNSDDRARALAAGYELHVSKPVEPSELVRAIAALIGPGTAENRGSL